MRFGGVARDIRQETLDKIARWIDTLRTDDGRVRPADQRQRDLIRAVWPASPPCPGRGRHRYGLVGPNLRATGLAWDVRRDEPYSIYQRVRLGP